jgi:hypothetical protein
MVSIGDLDAAAISERRDLFLYLRLEARPLLSGQSCGDVPERTRRDVNVAGAVPEFVKNYHR